jgi:ATP-dependent DNA helicase RecG
MGTQQSGVLNLQIADIVQDRDILALAREKTIKRSLTMPLAERTAAFESSVH